MKLKNIILAAAACMSLSLAQAQQTFPTETFKTKSGKDVVITLIKHASIIVSYEDFRIAIDCTQKFGEMTVDYSTMPKADVILVTHEHGDHFDKNAIAQLEKPHTVLILNGTAQRQLERGDIIQNFQSRHLRGVILLESVPAYNTTPDRMRYHPQGNGNGYILTIDGLRIYVAGDTEDIPEMANLKDIDVAFLPVNQPFTMTVGQAVHAVQMFKPKVLIPYHFSQTPIEQLKQALDAANSGIDVRLRDMQ